MLGIILTPGQAGDAPVGEELTARVVEIEYVDGVSADKAYDSNAIRKAIEEAGKQAVIPPRSNRLQPASYDKDKYKERNRVERLFNRLKYFRAVATRYDKLQAMFMGTVTVALLLISVK